MSALATTRTQVTKRLADCELPDCFTVATAAAEARLLAVPARDRTVAQRRDLRRVARQAARLEVRP